MPAPLPSRKSFFDGYVADDKRQFCSFEDCKYCSDSVVTNPRLVSKAAFRPVDGCSLLLPSDGGRTASVAPTVTPSVDTTSTATSTSTTVGNFLQSSTSTLADVPFYTTQSVNEGEVLSSAIKTPYGWASTIVLLILLEVTFSCGRMSS